MTTTTYPVHYHVDKPARFGRLQLLIRVLAFFVLGIVGLSLGLLFWAAYAGFAIFAGARLAGDRDPAAYLATDGPRVLRVLSWVAAIGAWFGLVADRLPDRSPQEIVRVEVEPGGRPTAGSALLRLLLGLPSALVLWVLGIVGWFVWLWAAACVLLRERVGDAAYRYLAGLQRWTIRLYAYQASLVEQYPPFSFDETPPELPPAQAIPRP
jgi:Domain of unknown function (DUF4389)